MRFYLGTHRTNWLVDTPEPLFVSRRTLSARKTLPRAIGPWALDSGGFTELSMFGKWTVTRSQYEYEVERFRTEIGNMDFAAPQDWMCEPQILAKTGLSVREHQRLTVQNFVALRARSTIFIPVLQGWTQTDYHDCVAAYRAEGIDLRDEPLVGLGSVCRRQAMDEATSIVRSLHDLGIRLHGFGFKILGLAKCAHMLASADSLAWSYGARRHPPLPECSGHKNCANCKRYALQWRTKVMEKVSQCLDSHISQPSLQPSLALTGA